MAAKGRLTKNRIAFCEFYVTDKNLNAKSAYRKAYPHCSDKTAETNGPRLLRNAQVKQHLKKLRADAMKRMKIKQDDILQELKTLGFSDISEFLEYNNNGVTLFDSKKVDTRAVQSVRQFTKTRVTSLKDGGKVVTTNTTVELKMHQKLQALFKLGEHLGLWDSEGKLRPIQVIIDT
jgi:phage terminase small subunit